MKLKFLSLVTLLVAGWSLQAAAQETKKFNCVADTWIWENSPANDKGTKDNGTKTTIEVQNSKKEIKEGDEIIETIFEKKVGLLGFEIEVPKGAKIGHAYLHMVTERYKVNQARIHLYKNNFDEYVANWDSEGNYIEEALENDYIQFNPAGESTKATFDGIKDENKFLSMWTNVIDVTDLLKDVDSGHSRVNFMIENGNETGTGDNRFYTKENIGIVKDNTILDWAQNFTSEDISPALIITFVNEDRVLTPVADTWVGPGFNDRGATGTIETKVNSDNEDHYGLMAFEIPPIPQGLKLKSAKLNLTTERRQASNNINIYKFNSNFEENLKWDDVKDEIAEIIQGNYIKDFTPKGESGKAIFDGINENSKNLAQWQNEIDLTAFVLNEIEEANTDTRINLLFQNTAGAGKQICFYTKEATNISTKNTDWIKQAHIVPSQVMPYLVLEYEPKEIKWSKKGELISTESPVNMIHRMDNIVSFTAGEGIDHSLIGIEVSENETESFNVKRSAEKNLIENETYTANWYDDRIDIQFKKAGNYTITPVSSSESNFSIPETSAISVSIAPLNLTVTSNNWSQPWSNQGNKLAIGITATDSETTLDYSTIKADLKYTFTPYFNGAGNGINTGKPESEMVTWEKEEMDEILKQKFFVDGAYTEISEYTDDYVNEKETVSLTTQFPCSGLYYVSIASTDEDITLNGKSTFDIGYVSIYPTTTNFYQLIDKNQTSYTTTFNINGIPANDEDNIEYPIIGGDLFEPQFPPNSTEEHDFISEAVFYTPGVYMADLYYRWEKIGAESTRSGVRRVEDQTTVITAAALKERDYISYNEELLNISDLVSNEYRLDVILVKNGVATPFASSGTNDSENWYTVSASDSYELPTGIETIDGSEASSEPEYYTLQGLKVKNPVPGQIYIRLIGTQADKVIF